MCCCYSRIKDHIQGDIKGPFKGVYKEFTPDSPWCAFLEVFYEANMEVTEKSVALLNC